jgi:hypothetical protein
MAVDLAAAEEVLDRCVALAAAEGKLPAGGRPRQLSLRTLLLGLILSIGDGRHGQLRRLHTALIGLPEKDKVRLGVVTQWRHGRHELTYRQVERTFKLATKAFPCHDGAPGEALSEFVRSLVSSSVPARYENVSSSLAIDWTDCETWGRPPQEGKRCADPEASFGRRHSNTPGVRDETFYGYYLQLATMVAEVGGPEVPELVRAMLLTSCHLDPPRQFVAVLERLSAQGFSLGDILYDTGYSYRVASAWAIPLRLLGASLVTDLHPNDRGPKGTYKGAILCDGNLYCPATPEPLLRITPLVLGASEEQIKIHDRQIAELARYKLGRISKDDAEGHHRVECPAVAGKLRCPLRSESMSLDHSHPEVTKPPEEEPLPSCCSKKSITVPPEVNAKTAQRLDFGSPAHRQSYGRRSAAERSNATLKDPSSTDIKRGSIRVCGQSAITIIDACAIVVRNIRITQAFEARQAENERRKLQGLPPRTRKRRRKTLADLAS